jgi:hypothetical protein
VVFWIIPEYDSKQTEHNGKHWKTTENTLCRTQKQMETPENTGKQGKTICAVVVVFLLSNQAKHNSPVCMRCCYHLKCYTLLC